MARSLVSGVTFGALTWICSQSLLANEPATLFWSGDHLQHLRNSPRALTPQEEDSLRQLERSANQALTRGPYSVVDKDVVPPSNDMHDYLSFSRYWWPNPDTSDGLPYVRRDGVVNRELLAKGDRNRIGEFYDDVESLALAAYLIDFDTYAPHAMKLIRTWFIDPATRMNPNVKYGQGVPGRAHGRGVGIIDTRHFIRVVDSLALLEELGAVRDADRKVLVEWFEDYLDWLTTSELGREERRADNNHGTWYSCQVACIALFVDRQDIARDILQEVRDVRVAKCIAPDGRQPQELERTRSLHYSLFSLEAFLTCARLSEQVDVDLWNWQAANGASLRGGLNYVVPYLADQDGWPYPEMDVFALPDRGAQLLALASLRWQDEKYLRLLERVDTRYEGRHFAPLLFPTLIDMDRGGYRVTVTDGFDPPKPDIRLPDLSPYSVEEIRRLVPTNRDGRVRVAAASEIELMDEAFRGDRGRDLERRQESNDPQVIVLDGGVASLGDLVEQLNDPKIAVKESDTVTLRLPLYISPGASLIVDGDRTPTLRLSTDRGAFVASAGRLFVLDAMVTSWSEEHSRPTLFASKNEFRPFVASYIRSKTYVAASTIQHLGFAAPTAYGFSLSSHPERDRGEASDDWPTGIIVDSEFRGLYYGFYSYEARDVAIVGNRYANNIVYGIDPHDRSTRLVIADNTATGTVERHGIIGSRGISDSFVLNNVAHRNKGSGIMLDRQCVSNVVYGNRVYQNGQGIAVYESPSNIIYENLVAFNANSGVRVRNSVDTEVVGNTIVGNNDYGLEVYAKRLDDHDKRILRGDTYEPKVSVSFYNNVVAGNRGIAKANQFSRLRIAGVQRNVDLAAIAERLSIGSRVWNTHDDPLFGSDLDALSAELLRAVGSDRAFVEIQRSDDSDKKQ